MVVVGADFHPAVDTELVARLGRDIVDGAAVGVPAEQGPLRPAQDFDPVHLDDAGFAEADARLVDAVDVEADVRDAADRHGGVDTVRALRAHDQVRHHGRQLLTRGDALQFELVRSDRRDRHGHVLEPLFGPLRGDDDLLKALVALRGRLLRKCGTGEERGCDRRSNEQRPLAKPATRGRFNLGIHHFPLRKILCS